MSSGETNLRPDVERTVEGVLETMANRDVLVEADDFESSGRYLIGPVLRRTAPSTSAIDDLSERAIHQWGDASRRRA